MCLSVLARVLAQNQLVYRNRILTLPHVADIEALIHIPRVKHEL